MQKNLKICFAASSGGHIMEINRLTGVSKSRDCFVITEEAGYYENNLSEKIYLVNQINRRQLTFIFSFIKIFVQCVRIIKKENADCVISTGALMGSIALLAGKLLGKKIIYIESFARVDSPSLSGRLMHPIADLFIVQWEDGLKFYPKAVLGGGIFDE